MPDTHSDMVRIARELHYDICYHPAQTEDFIRDRDEQRKAAQLSRIKQYVPLQKPPIPTCQDIQAFGWSLVMMVPCIVWGTTESGICALDGSFAVILDAQINSDRFSDLINLFNIAFLGILASAVSFVLWSAACRTLGVVKTTISLYLTPIVGVVFAAAFLGEKVTCIEAIGGCVILAGVALATNVKGDPQ